MKANYDPSDATRSGPNVSSNTSLQHLLLQATTNTHAAAEANATAANMLWFRPRDEEQRRRRSPEQERHKIVSILTEALAIINSDDISFFDYEETSPVLSQYLQEDALGGGTTASHRDCQTDSQQQEQPIREASTGTQRQQ